MIRNIGIPVLTLFGIGYFKYAPGTAASLITCLLFYILGESHFVLHDNKIYILIFVLFVFFYSIIFIDRLSKYFKKVDGLGFHNLKTYNRQKNLMLLFQLILLWIFFVLVMI